MRARLSPQSVVRCLAIAATASVALATAGTTTAQTPIGISLLDRYARGEFEEVVSALDHLHDLGPLYKDLRSNGRKWIDGGESGDRARRRLAAATFALEASRAGEMDDWKLVQNFVRLENIYWRPPAQLLEWGCQLLREDSVPQRGEHLWQLAALAVADRAEDFEFLIGSPWEDRANPKDEIEHLNHVAKRFPTERRFALAQGIAVEWRLFPSVHRPGFGEVRVIFKKLEGDPAVGAEASVRLGVTELRAGDTQAALRLFEGADRPSADAYVLYLARYFRGQALERLDQSTPAEAAYRGAVEAVPHAQTATFALAALLVQRGARSEAATLVDESLSTTPRPADPWRTYAEADDRFWPELITKLRAEIRR